MTSQMDLKGLLDLYRRDPRVQHLKDIVDQPTVEKLYLKGLVGSLGSFVASALFQELPRTYLFVLENKEEAAYFKDDLKNILDRNEVLFFPDSFKKPGYFDEVNKSNILLRTESVSRFMNSVTTGELLITYPEALLEKVVDSRTLSDSTILIKKGQDLETDDLVELLVENGFDFTDFVYEPGQFSVRGGIIDIFSFGNDLPYRVELFDTEVESLRIFDPSSQLSEKKITQLSIVPNIQTRFSGLEKRSLLEVLPNDTVVWIKNGEATEAIWKERGQSAKDILEELKQLPDVEETLQGNPLEHFLSIEELKAQLSELSVIEFGGADFYGGQELGFNAIPQPAFNKNFSLLIEDLRNREEENTEVFLFGGSPRQINRFHQIFTDLKAEVKYHPIVKSVYQGFIDQQLNLAVFTDHQIFDRYYKYNIKQAYSKNRALSMKLLKELTPGDFVTHIDHGVGRYSGLEKLEVSGKTQESVRIIYRDNDLLYVNIASLHKISKFVGKDGRQPRLSKLGSDTWQKLKSKTKKKIKDIANDLIALYAKRKATKGFAYQPDTYMQTELEASFIYEDTPDQLKATQDLKKDMESEHPMDRLVCGDVGFGKTEVAVRATAKALADNKQVAVLVPTTILAVQHYKTFKDRLSEFPCTVDYINRFRTAKEKRIILEKLEKGEIDVLIGTHSIVGKKVKFKDLGLLVIDEEQKFGVAVKEKLRQFKVNVDTLTLTATPIPRTLQFSLMSARDLSVMRTPPPNRQPIHTELISFDDKKIRDAIQYEVYRGGQVFFVHNRVKDLAEVAGMIKRLCPDIDVGMAHGQLDGKDLEDKMMKFINRQYDVLISTNIVESGLDIPNANTIIINNANHFGLSDLHQLRGRVGRSNKKAFCYLISPPLHGLPADSRRRLKTIEEFAYLGSGFNIAMKDLDIRGAGNLLGGEQSGFISDIGFHTFQKILTEAIQELRENEYKETFKDQIIEDRAFVTDCQIDTDLEMHIPDFYINKIDERLAIYRELNDLKNEEEIETFANSLRDRFGHLPKQVKELFNALRLSWIATRLGFERLVIKGNKLRCIFLSNQNSPYYQSPVFTAILGEIQETGKGQVKQTAKYLMLIFEGVNSLEKAHFFIEHLDNKVDKRLKASETESV